MTGPNPRKRPAPGVASSTARQQQQIQQQPYSTDPLLMWPGGVPDANSYMDSSANANAYMMNAQAPYGTGFTQPSTAITRRQPTSLVAAGQGWGLPDSDTLPLPSNRTADGNDSIESLEEKAATAKKDAQSKRKQIPPFVQKLSSFLEQQKNTDLIRWSEKGDSFIVVDEDEFAKKLIPELFKHNNYASFVRQLNMYGFHKRVGLSDNSMKASERKNKSPSEYYNPFFKRGHPNLLWLINKPKSGNKSRKGKKEDGDADSDEEADETLGLAASMGQAPRSLPAGDIGTVQKKDLQLVREQLNSLQQQQKIITTLITRLRQEHTTMYQQAVMFQNMHERHENSIKAILNFLANVFRKQLEEQGSPQNIKDLLDSIIPGAQMPQGGSVFEVGDIDLSGTGVANTVSPLRRQKQLLLPPVPQTGKASTVASPASNASPAPYNLDSPYGQSGMVTELFDTPTDASSPNYLRQDYQAPISEDGMMKIIQDTNASNPGGITLPESAAKTRITNLTDDQQNHLIGMMSGQQNPSQPGQPRSKPTVAVPNLTSGDAAPSGSKPHSLSPIISSMPKLKPPPIVNIQANQEQLDALQRLQDEQNAKLADIEQMLAPLSPSGRISPLNDDGARPPGYFDDVDQYFDSSSFDLNNYDLSGAGTLAPADLAAGQDGNTYDNAIPGQVDGSDFDFSLDQGADVLPDGLDANSGWHPTVVTGQSSSNNTPSPAVTEEIARNDLETSPTTKRRRVG